MSPAPPQHRLAVKSSLTMDDLNGETLVMPIMGISDVLDTFRSEVLQRYPGTRIIDSSYYGVDTFTMCEMDSCVLITQPVYSDIHTNLTTVPLETSYTMPYGWIYAEEPSPATRKFIDAARKIRYL